MLDDMETNYQHIIRQKHTHDDYVMHLFTAMLTSKNEEFNQMIQRSKDEWELGKDVTSDALIKTAVVKYNNLVKQKVWNRGESKDAKIVALATKVEELQTALATSSSSQSKSSSKPNGATKTNIPDWKKTNTGPSIEMEGRTWYWCPHHVWEGHYDGLYMNHKPEGHDEWKANKNKRKKPSTSTVTQSSSETNSGNSTSTSLTLSDKMKSALMTKCCFTEDQAKEFLDSVN